jgi:peptidyl-prolyl cis-trans isomerase SurA
MAGSRGARRARRVRLLKAALVLVVGALALAGSAGPARAVIVERVVAVIGERPILWTELVRRAGPTRIQIRMQTHDANVIAVQEQEMFKELLDRMIDDRLEEVQAEKSHLTASSEEIDHGISNIAAQAQAQGQGQPGHTITVQDVLSEVHRRGMSDQDFRDEIRRQILEGKLIELRVRPRVRVTDQDARTTYQHWTQEMKDKEPIDVHILALRVAQGATQAQLASRMALAQELADRAHAGTDFCELVTQYSEDTATRDSCGSRGPQAFATLLPGIQEAVRATKPDQVSQPVTVHVGQEDAIVLVRHPGEAKAPPYDDVKAEMEQQALIEAIERARKQWLKELRRNVYIDVRL